MTQRISYEPETLDAAKAAGNELVTLELDGRFMSPKRGAVTYSGHLLNPAERHHADGFLHWLMIHRFKAPPPDERLEREWETGF
ncbi:unnamed protein product [Gemmataceae bacterium]|nr:unnamed protein product [Gemmataceae bacterium]VTT96532.1 unnamed protein product [Gemmataceae bacterium]